MTIHHKLHKALPEATSRVLDMHLKELVEDGLVVKTIGYNNKKLSYSQSIKLNSLCCEALYLSISKESDFFNCPAIKSKKGWLVSSS